MEGSKHTLTFTAIEIDDLVSGLDQVMREEVSWPDEEIKEALIILNSRLKSLMRSKKFHF